MGVYRVEETIKEKFVINAIQVEMQCCHFYILCHAWKTANATIAYWAKHGIVDTDIV